MSLARARDHRGQIEGRTKSEVARDYRISRYWVQQLVKRFEPEGEAAFQPRSRRPHRQSRGGQPEVEDGSSGSARSCRAGARRRRGHDPRPPASGPGSNRCRRSRRSGGSYAPRIRHPAAAQAARSRPDRFAAEQPNERWQADITHWGLADGTDIEILNILDDHSRLPGQPHPATSTAPTSDQLPGVRRHWEPGQPAHRQRRRVHRPTPRRGRVALEFSSASCGVRFDHSRPYHPQTCGKVERFHQTLKKWLAAPTTGHHRRRAATQLDPFRRYYNTIRPHRALGRRTPAQAYTARPKADPTGPLIDRPLPHPPRPHRPQRRDHPAPQQPTAPHRPRPRPMPAHTSWS